MATGSIHLQANSVNPVSTVSPYAALYDGLTFYVAGGGSADITVGLSLDGTESAAGASTGFYTNNIALTLGGANFDWAASQTAGGTAQEQTNANYGWDTNSGAGSLSGQSATGVVFTAPLLIANGEDLQFLLNDGLTCTDGVQCNFLNTLQFSLELPTGVSFTSDSGVFLSQSATAATPEPASVIPPGIMLLSVAVARYRRTRRA